MIYQRLTVRGSDRNWQPLAEQIRQESLLAWQDQGVSVWGVWHGLFGLASNELYVVLVSEQAVETASQLPDDSSVINKLVMTPTVRPETPEPCTTPGLYVFRTFEVNNADVDAVAALSKEAWATFEATDAYRAQPMGLFCEADRSNARGRMLLVTWYDGLESWQTSRAPPPEARDNFRRRHALTYSTAAVATRLVEPKGLS
jgi:hypothetical protein